MRSDAIEPNLPWGYWFRVEPKGDYSTTIVCEETGREWASVREALWVERLRQSPSSLTADKMEFLHRVLSAFARGMMTSNEIVADIFKGNGGFQQWYYSWLMAAGFIDNVTQHAKVTNEGRSVLIMLMATRPYVVRKELPSAATVEQLRSLGLGPNDREARLHEVEVAAVKWDVAFLRKQIGARPTVTLFSRGEGPMPLHKPVWTMHFDTPDLRDDFYEWLCFRFDRWIDWAEIAARGSNEKLSQHLLSVMTASLAATPNRSDKQLTGVS